ncbi:MAG: CotH kinase family protein [Bacteroidales bacterium]|nr:CotH kinase family protein [Candidatus Hennigimonas equi]
MSKDKEWVLLANYADKSLLRNITAMEMSRILGFSWTPVMISVEFYLNGEYQGVYVFTEHKKVSKNRVNIFTV